MKQWVVILTVFGLLGCNAKQEDSDAISADTAVTESVSSALSALADEQSGSSMAQAETTLMTLLFPRAYADACQRPFYQTCQSGVKSDTYQACPLYQGTVNGEANLVYSSLSCDLSSNGQTVTRNYNLTLQGPRGGTYSVTSDSSEDYKGNTYGGGEVLTKTSGGWSVNILGRHKYFVTRRGREAYNVSVRTLQPYNISGGLSRSTRTVDGGQIEINHNLAGFTATIVPSQIEWSNSCCHPVSGTLSVTYSGARTGSASRFRNMSPQDRQQWRQRHQQPRRSR